jgi:hypothetical protein|tara:strand:- start:6 stop:278 length:273 start_codon:yes stop_codon:yes gene_type:complete
MKDEELRAQINELIKGEIQEGINDYIDSKEESEKTGLGFVQSEDEQLKVNISNKEVDRLIKEYKKIKKRQKSNLNQIRLLDKFGNPIKKP